LLWGERDEDIWQFFLQTGFPVQWHAEQVVEYLEAAADGVGQRDIEEQVNMPSSRIGGLLKGLDVEAPPRSPATSSSTPSSVSRPRRA
jgi:ATP-dependent DNA helicase RecQ